jgi:hypothetical protein
MTSDHPEKCDAHTPEVHLKRIIFAAVHLWRHIVRCSASFVRHVLGVSHVGIGAIDAGTLIGIGRRGVDRFGGREHLRHPEVSQHNVAVSPQEDIAGFDIPVDNILVVKAFNR